MYEAIRVDDKIRSLINSDGDEAALSAHAFAKSSDLARAARALVLEGKTTAEEAIRILRREAVDD